jgi:outer membrane receptor for ferrienterochelin and colicins
MANGTTKSIICFRRPDLIEERIYTVKKLLAFMRGVVFLAGGMLGIIIPGLSQTPPQGDTRDLTSLPLEELNKVEVYSASKFSQKATEAPASISIITAIDIQRYGYRTFDEILRSATGFYTTYDRNYAYIGVRGFGLTGDYNSRILLLIDGHRMNENIYGSTYIGTDFPLPLDLIERIEVVRGPGSSLYGTNAFFAVINVITKRGRIFNGGYLSLSGASRQTYEGTVAYGRQLDSGLEILVAGAYMRSKGNRRLYFPEFDNPGNNNGIAEDADTEHSTSFFTNVTYRDISAQFVCKAREKRIPTASFGTVFNDRRTMTTDAEAYLELKFDHKIRDQWNVLARTSVDAYEDDGVYIYNYSPSEIPDLVANRDRVKGRWWSGEFQVTRIFAGRHHITVGTEWRYSYKANQLNYDETEYHLYLDSRRKPTDTGTYLQGELAATDNILLSAGVRYDNYSTFGGTTNPHIGVVYSPWKKTTAKLLYGHAFRAPNLYELYYQDNASSKGNENLQPEKIRTFELVLEQFLGRKFRVAGSAYKYRVRDQITQTLDPIDGLLTFINSGNVNAQGIEMELEAKDWGGIDSRISYAVQRAVRKQGAALLPNSPQHLIQLNLFKPLLGMKGGAGLEMRYMSSRKTLGDNRVGGSVIANVTAFYRKLLPNLDLSAGIYNVFNRRYSDPGGHDVSDDLLQDGRSFRIKLGYGFPLK